MGDLIDEKAAPEVVNFVLKIVQDATGVAPELLGADTSFEEIGLDSLAITTFNRLIQPTFPGLSKTLLFDCRCVRDVAMYLLRHHSQAVGALVDAAEPRATIARPAPGDAVVDAWPLIPRLTDSATQAGRDIAIIGLHGRYPGADTLDEFWDNLQNGIDSIQEIPGERWALEGFFAADTDSRNSGLSYAKWGGFLQGIDHFDAQFFAIPPRDAALLDPQERLFLECAWHALEDSGYCGERAELLRDANGSLDVGVFVGITSNTFPLLGPALWQAGNPAIPSGLPWSVANRVSYVLNFCGPSLAIDTACSSSLMALHAAVASLRNGECRAALVGGVNLYTHPAKYVQLCQQHMLSPTGRCHAFGRAADGFVPGEGVAAVVLKPLSAAQRDGDRILAVIKGSAVNHGGRTNGYTVPSSLSQAALITRALADARLPAESIGYIEAHGTGTRLGDPVELAGLRQALASGAGSLPCHVGSVKSNIGHLEAAAGMASLTKVVLQMQHRRLVPSLYAQQPNPDAAIDDTRLRIVQAVQEWSAAAAPLRAGISSFGAGGANAHVIVEQAPDDGRPTVAAGLPVFVLSARSEQQLRVQAGNLLAQLARDAELLQRPAHWYGLAYTLQCCRQAFDHRLAIAARDVAELQRGLDAYMAGSASAAWHYGRVLPASAPSSGPLASSPEELAGAWTAGKLASWSAYWSRRPAPVAAPLYPFVKERHWPPSAASRVSARSRDWPLSAQAFFLRDHVVQGSPVLPAAAYIDFCRSEAEHWGLRAPLEFVNLTWASPITVAADAPRTISCRSERQGEAVTIAFAASPASDAANSFRGECRPLLPATGGALSLAEVRAQCAHELPLEQLYPALAQLGIEYGPSFRCVAAAWVGDRQALTRVIGRLQQRPGEPLGALDPALLDAVLQSAFVTAAPAGQPLDVTFVPYACKSLRYHAALPEQFFVHVRPQPAQGAAMRRYDFTAYGEDGGVLLEIRDFVFRVYEREAANRVELLEPCWQELPLPVPAAEEPVTLLVGHDARLSLPDSAWRVRAGAEFLYRDQRSVEADLGDPAHVDLLLRLLATRQEQVQTLTVNLLTPSAISGDGWQVESDLLGVIFAARVLRNFCQALAAPRLQVQVLVPAGPAAGIGGLLRSLVQELPTLSATLIEVVGELTAESAAAIRREMFGAPQPGFRHVRLLGTRRQLSALRFVEDAAGAVPAPSAPGAGDVLLITGGLGAVGRALTQALARLGGVHLALLGRSPLDSAGAAWLHELNRAGAASADYWQADCCEPAQLQGALAAIRDRFGAINGVIHCAGVLQDGFFVRQEPADWTPVLRTKAYGAQLLDQATAADRLKLFMVCSSLAGVYGNVGQGIYALANAWLDRFVTAREQRCRSGERQGRSLSIAWPLWQTEQGMQAPESVRQWLGRNGLALLAEAQGQATFLSALALAQPVVVPVCGQREAIARMFQVVETRPAAPAPVATPAAAAIPAPTAGTPSYLLDYLARQLSAVTATALERIDPDAALEVFGLDSILVMELNARLETRFPELSKTVLFEVRSLRELAGLLQAEHGAEVARLAPAVAVESAPLAAVAPAVAVEPAPLPVAVPAAAPAVAIDEAPPALLASPPAARQDIAIIGLAGRYPGARDPHALWEHLAAGDDLLSEVPGRWEQPAGDDGLYARWGGFVDDVDCFDPLFFGISPRDAERMDPQERLFLQAAWHAVEDAGYTPQSLSGARQGGAPRRRVAVIAGVMYGEYQFYGAASWPKRPQTLTNSSYASIANRVSFCLDLEGPSFAVDSMCSSSLTSLHLACDLIRSGSCEMALAGGVNLSLHPYKYRTLCELKFASSEGKCRSFGEGGDGYVPGEGVGVALLKPLQQALRDGDHVYGVIRGSDLNHGGRTSGYTVPNADAQAQVIGRALQRAGLPAERLGYIEAHGTGTSLGDPIEIRGLSKALAAQLPEGWSCPIGSIKSNIGHLESAAGMAALTKVLLQFKHQQLVPSLHAQPQNRNIDFARTPFVVQQQLADWPARSGADRQPLPRVAAISSFGAGGANAHLIVEELPARPATAATGMQPFVFSARSDAQLHAYLQRFVALLEREHAQPADYLGRERFTTLDVARTLLEGRLNCAEARLVVIAGDFDELRLLLGRWLLAGETSSGLVLAGPAATAGCRSFAAAWLAGQTVELPAAGAQPWRRVPLPGYEFLRRRYWAAPSAEATAAAPGIPPVAQAPTAAPATPKDILARLARREISEEQARSLLQAML